MASPPIDEIVRTTFQIPAEWGTYHEFLGYEPKPAFRVYDAEGAELPYQLLSQDMTRTKARLHPRKFPEAYKTHDVTVAVRLKIPALGYTTLTVREGAWTEKSGPIAAAILPTRHPQSPGLVTSERSMANSLISVVIESNGSLIVTDKRNGRSYARLLTFEDCADIGDGWYHGPAVNDQRFVSTAAHADVALVHDGPFLAQFRIRATLRLPEEFDFAKMRRSETFAPMRIDSLVTLRAGSDRVEVETAVENSVKDHRLRALFPTGLTGATTYLADSAFDVVERKIGLPANNHLNREIAVETTPQQTWTAVTDGGHGLAVVAAGLHETVVIDLPERPLALTLFRSTRRTVLTDGQPDGQLQGRLGFRFWILPLADEPDRRRLFDAGLQLAAPVRTVQLQNHDVPLFRQSGHEAPREASLLRVDGGAVVTSARQVDGAFEVRVFNPSGSSIRAALTLPASHGKNFLVRRVDFESQALEPGKQADATLDLTLKPKEIVTCRFEMPE